MKRVKYTRNPLIDSQPIVDFRDMLKKTVDRLPEDKAVYLYSRKKQDFSLTYKDFYENIRALGTALYKRGLAGSATAVIGEADPAYMTTYYATVITGGVIVPLDKDISDEEIINFIKLANVRTVVYTASQNNRIGKLAELLPDVQIFSPVTPETEEAVTEKTVALPTLIEEGKAAYGEGETFFETVPQDLEKCSAIIFTSGTTGTSKGVMLSQGNLVSNAMMSANVIDQLDDRTTLLSVLPMHHTYEVTTGQLTAHY
ncbi:MAG: acyl--CoA ligase, partial [Clostridia bacterium]|nr:acyl--CoA ligase [Clostridia bacterium]